MVAQSTIGLAESPKGIFESPLHVANGGATCG
jgi:hypothetical protein